MPDSEFNIIQPAGVIKPPSTGLKIERYMKKHVYSILAKRIIREEKKEPLNHPSQINRLIEKYKNSETYTVRHLFCLNL